MRVDAVLPAGGRISDSFADEVGTEIKALIRFDGRPILDRTIETLRATGLVDRIVVIGPKELASHRATAGADAVLPEAETGPANIVAGLEWLRDADGAHADRVLIVTTDLPFLTPEVITDFVNRCPARADLCLPLIHRQELEGRFPGVPAEYVLLSDGEWTMGCAFLVNPVSLLESRRMIDRVFVARKSKVAMARLLGVSFLLRFIARRLAVGDIERRCVELLGCVGLGIRETPPELAFDIDGPEEYHYAIRSCKR